MFNAIRQHWRIVISLFIILQFVHVIVSFQLQQTTSATWFNRRSLKLSMKVRIDEISVKVNELQPTLRFYNGKMSLLTSSQNEAIFNFGDGGKAIFTTDTSGQLDVGKGLIGFTFGRPNADQLAKDAVTESNVLRPFDTYQYGASLIPDEDEMKYFDVQYGWIKDPMGYRAEFRQDTTSYDRVVLNVVDIDESIDIFTNVFGFSLLRKRSNVNNRPREPSFSAYLGNESEKEASTIELKYHYSTDVIKHGNSFQEIVLKTDNLARVEEAARLKELKIVSSNDGSIIITDLNGYKVRVRQQ